MNNRTKKLFALGMIVSLSLGQAHVISAEPTTRDRVVNAGKKIVGTAVGAGLGLVASTSRIHCVMGFLDGLLSHRIKNSHGRMVAAGLGAYILYKTWKPAAKPATEDTK